MTTPRERQAADFAVAPEAWDEPRGRRIGPDAASHGRALLGAAGVDVEAVERRVGRPSIGGASRPKGERSARLNVAITDSQAATLAKLTRKGHTRSDIVRDALDAYLASSPRA